MGVKVLHTPCMLFPGIACHNMDLSCKAKNVIPCTSLCQKAVVNIDIVMDTCVVVVIADALAVVVAHGLVIAVCVTVHAQLRALTQSWCKSSMSWLRHFPPCIQL